MRYILISMIDCVRLELEFMAFRPIVWLLSRLLYALRAACMLASLGLPTHPYF